MRTLTTLFTIIFFLISADLFADDQECEVQISTQLPQSFEQYELHFYIGAKIYPIDFKHPKICLSKEALGVFPRRFSTAKIALNANIKGQKIFVYGARAHIQAKVIEVNALSTMANDACDSECGFYEYNKLLRNEKIITSGKKYFKKIVSDSAVFVDFPKRRVIYIAIEADNKGIFDALLPKVDTLEKMPEHARDYGISPYSGASRYWSKYKNLSYLFSASVRSKKKEILKNADKKLFRDEFKTFGNALKEQSRRNVPWDTKKLGFKVIAQEMMVSDIGVIQNYGKMMFETVEETDKSRSDYLNSARADFKFLTDENQDKTTTLAHWFRYAFHYAEDTDKFATLFSKSFRLTLFNDIATDKNLDSSLSKSISLYERLSMSDNDIYAFQRIMNEYQDSIQRESESIIISDDLEQFSFIYENGQWRMDSLNILAF